MSDVMKELARPFPEGFVHTNPSGGGSYVKHHVVEQRLIHVLGYPPSFERVEIIYGDVPAIPPNPNGSSKRAKEGRDKLTNVVVAVVARLTVKIEDHRIVVEEAGDCEQPHNWETDGQRLKDAMSDAYKRCAMRLGCGLHLWSQDEYFLFDKLETSEAGSTPVRTGNTEPTAERQPPETSQAPVAPPQDVEQEDGAGPADSNVASSGAGDHQPPGSADDSPDALTLIELAWKAEIVDWKDIARASGKPALDAKCNPPVLSKTKVIEPLSELPPEVIQEIADKLGITKERVTA